jgi:hypothetical protein
MNAAMIEKVKKLMQMSDCERCFASKARGTIIDVLRPATGLTACYGKTLAQIRDECPDATEMSIDEFCAWKSSQQRTPITWEPTTAERFDEMLGVLPPAAMRDNGFLVGEPWDHDALNGQPRFSAYRKRGDVYEVSNRPMTRAEFRAEMTTP